MHFIEGPKITTAYKWLLFLISGKRPQPCSAYVNFSNEMVADHATLRNYTVLTVADRASIGPEILELFCVTFGLGNLTGKPHLQMRNIL